MLEKNLTEFETHDEYVNYTGGTSFIKPNVSYCDDRDEVHYAQLYVIRGITISETAATIATNETRQLTASIIPPQATQDVEWASSNEGVATVSANGLVSPVSIGNATITVTSVEDPSFSAQCEIEVIPVLPTGITISESAITVPYSRTYQLTATVLPEDADDKSVEWSSSDETVATVTQDGLVTSVGKGGSCTITVKTSVGGYQAQCEVTSEYVPVTGITLTKDYTDYVVYGRQVTVTATVLPENASVKGATFAFGGNISKNIDNTTDTTVTFTITTDTSTYNNRSLTITATSVDNTSVTASTSCTYRSSGITGVTLSDYEEDIEFSNTHTLTATTLPTGATYEEDTIRWESSDEDIIKIIQYNGSRSVTVQAVGLGDATITFTAGFKNKTASCIYHAYGVHVTGVTISETAATVADNHTYQLTAEVVPADSSVKRIIWSSSDESIATVDDTGLVKAYKVGNCVITATAADGGASASCNLEVVFDYTGIYLTTVTESEGTRFNADDDIYYSMDGGVNWQFLDDNDFTPATSVGQEILWKRNSDDYGLNFSGTTGMFSLKGNLLSLQYGDDFKFKDELHVNVFQNLFKGCTGLTSAEGLRIPVKRVSQGSLWGTFKDCTNLTSVYEYLFSTVEVVDNSGFRGMFQGCTSLTTDVHLYGTPGNYGYYSSYYAFQEMYEGCTSITSVTIDTPVVTNCTDTFNKAFKGCTSLQRVDIPNLRNIDTTQVFYEAFSGCTSLNYIRLLAESNVGAGDYSFKNWVAGVAADGTFVKSANATFWTRGVNGIPEGWTVIEEQT